MWALANITFPPIFPQQTSPFPKTVRVPCVRRIYNVQEDVVEESLKSRDGGTSADQQ